MCRAVDAPYHRAGESGRLALDDGTKTLINCEFPIAEEGFEEVVRYSDISRMVSSGRLNFDMDMYWYLHRRSGVTPV